MTYHKISISQRFSSRPLALDFNGRRPKWPTAFSDWSQMADGNLLNINWCLGQHTETPLTFDVLSSATIVNTPLKFKMKLRIKH